MQVRAAMLGLVAALSVACFSGGELEDKEPPPGYAGGMCLPEGCYLPNNCVNEHNVCFDPQDPCKGIYCGGHGTCGVDLDTGEPFCSCDPGYSNEAYAYYCQ